MKQKLQFLTTGMFFFAFQSLIAQGANIPAGSEQKVVKPEVKVPLETKSSNKTYSILNYIQSTTGVDLSTMLTGKGYSVTNSFDSPNDLATEIGSGTYDIVIAQVHSDNLQTVDVTAIADYIDAGGKVIISYWDLDGDADLRDIVGVSSTTDIFAPLDMFVWDASHDIFNTPNTITSTDLETIGDNAGNDNGDRMTIASDGIAIAGYTASVTAGEASIVLSNNNNSIYHGFAGPDFNSTAFTNLVENEVEYLINKDLVGVKENTLSNNISAYPIPASSFVTFTSIEKINKIEIYSVTGKLLGSYSETNTIDVSNLPNGVYTAKVNVGKYTTFQKLIIE